MEQQHKNSMTDDTKRGRERPNIHMNNIKYIMPQHNMLDA